MKSNKLNNQVFTCELGHSNQSCTPNHGENQPWRG